MIGAGPRLRYSSRPNSPAIYVNDPNAAQSAGIDVARLSLGREAYHLETRGGSLYLLGGGPRGVIYAVYDLLDSLGCRWFTPEISHYPKRPDLELAALARTAAPAFESRDIYNFECHEPLWWVRNRLNGWYTSLPEYMGGNVGYCGFVHTFYTLLPPEEFFDAHPEYFSLVDGQRRRDYAQICLTHPDVLRIVTQRVLELMRTHPRATIFSVSQNDCTGYCECDSCRALAEAEGAQSGPLIHFVNAVAAETAKVYPDKLIDTLAYMYTLEAPRGVTPHPNVRVRLCPIKCCQGHAYGTCDHPVSTKFKRALDDWASRTSQLYVWHYATNFSHYPLPMPNLDELHQNLNYYHDRGVHGLFIQGMGENGGGAEGQALRGYVLSQLLWQPRQAVWPVVDEFLAAYYGAAAPMVRRYLDIYHQNVRNDVHLHPSLYDLPTSRLFADDLRIPADQALAEAETMVRGQELQRVRLLRGGLRYARLYRAGGTFRRTGDLFHGDATRQDVREFDALVRLWKQSGVRTVSERDPLSFSVFKLRGRLTPHRVRWIAKGQQRVAAAPSLGGRLLEWHAFNHQWLSLVEPDRASRPDVGGYIESMPPNAGGYSDFAILGMYESRGWGETYQASRQGDALVMNVVIDPNEAGVQGVRITRKVWLSDGKLQIESQVLNCGLVPQAAGWVCALNLDLPSAGTVAFETAHKAERIPWEALSEAATLTLSGDRLPAGRWRVEMDAFTLHHTLEGIPFAQLTLDRVENRFTLSLGVRTGMPILQPGDSFTIRQALWIEARR
jgi:hypothetical protein